MAQKHLKELLNEDQEPFFLKDYIADRQCQLKKQPQNTKLQLKKSKPMSKTTSILCKNACFFSLQDSPDLRKSPKLFDFPASPVPNKSPTRVFLHVPAKTASLLLEAAIRIQKQKSKPKTQIKNSSFGLFGSMLKRLTLKNRTQKLKNGVEKTEDEIKGDMILVNLEQEKVATISSSVSSSSTSSCSCNGRLSSLDLESSSSGRSFEDDDEDDNDFQFENILKEDDSNINDSNNDGDYYSPLCLSPFRFTLPRRSPSPEYRSPVRCKLEDNVKYEHESLAKFQEEEDEEDKEQNSPVSVLDPPFEDDYDGHEEDNYDDIECSYAFVHRAQKELLYKLQRFEKLAELDPIELEKRMIEAEEEYTLEQATEFEEYDHVSFTFHEQTQAHEFMQEVIRKSGFQDVKKPGIKRLISDLIVEEDREVSTSSDEQVIKRVCKRLESWKEVESNTIDMMVEMDLRKEINDWKKSQKEIEEAAMDVEVAIFAVLVDELLEELA